MTNQKSGKEMIECENHPGQEAVSACDACGKPVCGDCAVSSEWGNVCDRPEHQKILSGWATVFTCDSEFEADSVQRNLENTDIQTCMFSGRDHLSLYWTFQHENVRVMVPREEAERAAGVLQELGLSDFRAE